MVRFIPEGLAAIAGPAFRSQFHYGSIHTLSCTSHAFMAWEVSQFHYGSIHTFQLLRYGLEMLVSQFHYGSIHTIGVQRGSNYAHSCLNSTMVRFILRTKNG